MVNVAIVVNRFGLGGWGFVLEFMNLEGFYSVFWVFFFRSRIEGGFRSVLVSWMGSLGGGRALGFWVRGFFRVFRREFYGAAD